MKTWITDRTSADVERVKHLRAKHTLTEVETAEWLSEMKGRIDRDTLARIFANLSSMDMSQQFHRSMIKNALENYSVAPDAAFELTHPYVSIGTYNNPSIIEQYEPRMRESMEKLLIDIPKAYMSAFGFSMPIWLSANAIRYDHMNGIEKIFQRADEIIEAETQEADAIIDKIKRAAESFMLCGEEVCG
jgi:hypothetical protein